MRSALTYRAECCRLRAKDERKLKTTKMRMLRMTYANALKDKINNENIPTITGEERLEKFLREQRLRWLGHVERIDEGRGPVEALHLKLVGKKKAEKKKKRSAEMQLNC